MIYAHASFMKGLCMTLATESSKWVLLILFVSTAAFAAQGGISGGGGGTVPTDLVSTREIQDLIINQRWQLELFFHQLEIQSRKLGNKKCSDAICEKLFDFKKSIIDVMREVSIHFEMTGLCQAPDGSLHDGAAPGPTPASICISVDALSKKISRSEARPQVLALIAHEVSHLMGLTEEDAYAIQKDSLDAFNGKRSNEIENKINAAYQALVRGSFLLDRAISTSEDWYATSETHHWLSEAQKAMESTLSPESDNENTIWFPLIRWNELGLSFEIFWRIEWLQISLCGNPGDLCRGNLDKAFDSSTVKTFGELISNYRAPYSSRPNSIGFPIRENERVERVASFHTFQREIVAIREIYQHLLNRVSLYHSAMRHWSFGWFSVLSSGTPASEGAAWSCNGDVFMIDHGKNEQIPLDLELINGNVNDPLVTISLSSDGETISTDLQPAHNQKLFEGDPEQGYFFSMQDPSHPWTSLIEARILFDAGSSEDAPQFSLRGLIYKRSFDGNFTCKRK